MMTANLHCNYANRYDVTVQWVRCHGNQPVGSQDYLNVTISGDGAEVILFLSPDQALELAARLHTACQDRDIVLAEEAAKAGPLELAGDAEEGVVKGGDSPVRQTWQFGRRESEGG